MAACKDCGNSISFFSGVDGRCASCHFEKSKKERGASTTADAVIDLPRSQTSQAAVAVSPPAEEFPGILLSTEAAPDLVVSERLAIITAEYAVGMGALTDLLAGLRDVFGGRSKAYQSALKDARLTVLRELRREASQLGADAVLGVDLDYSEISGGGKSMMFLVASGTAVRLAKQ